MLKREVEYEDFNGNKVSETFYFNLSKPELIEMEVQFEGGFGNLIQRIVEEKDSKELVKHFKAIILMSYGQKTPDGKRFVKSDELRKEFEQSAAYEVLFMDLATNDDSAAKFMRGILPTDIAQDPATIRELPKQTEQSAEG